MRWLWLLTRIERTGDPIYDCHNGFVIAASTEAEAREFAAGERGDEGTNVWRDPDRSLATVIGATLPGREPGLVLRDFHAG